MRYFIAHRGNISYRIPELENTKSYIDTAIENNYDVEIDIWSVNNKLYLGHDEPKDEVDLEFLYERHNKLWCHTKNIEALSELIFRGLHCFFHDKDLATLTSKKFIWTYPGEELTKNSISVLPETSYKMQDILGAAGICSDCISEYKYYYENNNK